MPTGYTAGILDGEIKTFEQFAKLCVRNFGAAMHMRDEPMDKTWEPRKPTDYHTKAIAEANKLLNDSVTLSDQEVLTTRKAELFKSKAYHTESLSKMKANEITLRRFLSKAEEYTPPTAEHGGIRSFMIDQITETIRFDCTETYTRQAIENIDKELKTITPESVRLTMIEKASKDLDYHMREQALEIERCTKANEWAQQFFESISGKELETVKEKI